MAKRGRSIGSACTRLIKLCNYLQGAYTDAPSAVTEAVNAKITAAKINGNVNTIMDTLTGLEAIPLK